MKVLLTGASGFVGSHVLDSLRARNIDTALFLRPESSPRYLRQHLSELEVRRGALNDPASLQSALAGITHVIHCAGATKALRPAEFMESNHAGTRNLVQAVNGSGSRVERLVHISSLAAAGPAGPDQPAREEDAPAPVSLYGRSKLAGEQEVVSGCRIPFVILRPPAVYGPRDAEFLRVCKVARAHLRLSLLGGLRALSLVYVRDLATAVVAALTHPRAEGRTYYVASHEVVTLAGLAREIAARLGVWTVPLALPVELLWPVCLAQEGWSRLTGRPSVLGWQKYAELRARAWVCDPTRIERELEVRCPTRLKDGLDETLASYRQEGWL
jgi:nucleoside-diphosphate-sugar epimerase